MAKDFIIEESNFPEVKVCKNLVQPLCMSCMFTVLCKIEFSHLYLGTECCASRMREALQNQRRTSTRSQSMRTRRPPLQTTRTATRVRVTSLSENTARSLCVMLDRVVVVVVSTNRKD